MVIKVSCDTSIVESKKLYSANKDTFLEQNQQIIAHKNCKSSVISTIKMTPAGIQPSENLLSDISSYFSKTSLLTNKATLEHNIESLKKIGEAEFISLLVTDESLKNTYTAPDAFSLADLDVVSLFACFTKKNSENPLEDSIYHYLHDVSILNTEPYPDMLIPKKANNTFFHVNPNLVQILLTPGHAAQVDAWESFQSNYDPYQTVGDLYFDSNSTVE